jgi:hypothetical protein
MRPIARAAYLCALAAPLAAAVAQPVVSIEVRTAPGPRLLIDYVVPAGVDALQFLSQDPRSHSSFRQSMLRPLDDCARLTPTRLERVRNADAGADEATRCARWRFEVEPRRLGLYAFYEPAQPVGDGVLLHTRHYVAAAPGLGLRWHFRALPQQVVATGGRWESEITFQSSAAPTPLANSSNAVNSAERADAELRSGVDQYVFIGSGAQRIGRGYRMVQDSAVPPWLADAVAQVASLALDRYSAALGSAPASDATLLLTAGTASGPRQPGEVFHGDVTPGQMIRMHFAAPPAQPDASLRTDIDRFVAHELAHLWHARTGATLAQPWLHEGGADWMAAVLLRDAGLVGPERLGAQLQAALTGCLLEHGNSIWREIKAVHSRAYAYNCGLVLHALAYRAARAQATASHAANDAARKSAAASDPLAITGALQRSAPEFDEAAFVAAVQGYGPGGQALARTVRDGDVTLADGLRQVMRALQIEQRETPLAELGLPNGQALFRIGGLACSRFVGFFRRDDHIEFDADNQCTGLPPRARVAQVQGVPVPKDAVLALDRVAQRCVTAPQFDITLHDGSNISVACPTASRGRLPPSLPQFTPEALADFVPPPTAAQP